MSSFGHYFTTRDGLRLFYRDYPSAAGAGRAPVVCLHGLTRNSDDFEDIAKHLRAKRRVLSIDLRGRGRSDFDPDYRNYRTGAYLADLEEWFERLRLGPFVALGTSLGGLLSMAIAGQRPGQLAGVILNDIGPELAPPGVARIASYVGNMQPPGDWPAAVRNVQTMFAQALPDFGPDDWERMARRTYRAEPDGTVSLRSDAALGRALAEEGGPGPDAYWPLFEALVPVPVLLLRGALSDLLTPEIVAKMLARKPDIELVTVALRGHVPQLDEPAVVAAIDTFLARIP